MNCLDLYGLRKIYKAPSDANLSIHLLTVLIGIEDA